MHEKLNTHSLPASTFYKPKRRLPKMFFFYIWNCPVVSMKNVNNLVQEISLFGYLGSQF